jgi:hypothetical protein
MSPVYIRERTVSNHGVELRVRARSRLGHSKEPGVLDVSFPE